MGVAAFLILLAVFTLNFAGRPVPVAEYRQMIAAARRVLSCQSVLFQEQAETQKAEDPNRTGLIGVEYSQITTTLGDLAAKRTSTQPDFAALLVRWFCQLGLQKGDVVAIGCSGSFPALILATICAAEVCELQPVLIASVGASSYGANCPEQTWLDLEQILFLHKLIAQRAQAASLGGSGDVAAGLTAEGQELLRQAVARNQISLIYQPDLVRNLAQRVEIYFKPGRPGVFVNIGGAQMNVGNYAAEKLLQPGLNFPAQHSTRPETALTNIFLNQGIPVIHLLHIEQLALENSLPIDPQPFPEPGTTAIYYQTRSGIWWLAVVILAVCAGIILN
jgi:poly-gamma-glutamate system protein